MTPTARFTTRGALAGARQMLPVALSEAVYGLVFGVLARQAGLTWTETLLMSALVNAGAAQFAAIAMWGGAASTLSIMATTFTVNLRHILMGMSLRRWVGRLRWQTSLLLAFFITDESWALTMQEFTRGRTDTAFLVGSGIMQFPFWLVASVVGNLAASRVPDPAAWGLDFAFTGVLVSLLVGMWQGRSSLWPWVAACAAALLAALKLPGNWSVVLGGLAGVLAGAMLDD